MSELFNLKFVMIIFLSNGLFYILGAQKNRLIEIFF